MIKTIIATEWMKNKHTFTPWFLLIGSLVVPFICFMIYLNRWSLFVPEAGSNGWAEFLHMNVSLFSSLMLPVWLILLVALNIYPEQKGNTWKRLFVTPVGRGNLFVGKLVYLFLQVFLAMFGFMLSLCLVGLVVQLMHPTLSLSLSGLPLLSMLSTLSGLMVSSLAIVTLQYVFSLFTTNVLIPATTGLFLVIISMILSQGWSYVVYDPYVFPLLYSWNTSGKSLLPIWLGLPSVIWLSLIISVTAAFLGRWKFKQQPIR